MKCFNTIAARAARKILCLAIVLTVGGINAYSQNLYVYKSGVIDKTLSATDFDSARVESSVLHFYKNGASVYSSPANEIEITGQLSLVAPGDLNQTVNYIGSTLSSGYNPTPTEITVLGSDGWTAELTTDPNDEPALHPTYDATGHKWVTITQSSGGSLKYIVDANPFNRSRIARINVTGGDYAPAEIVITQTRCEEVRILGMVLGSDGWKAENAVKLTETVEGSGIFELEYAFAASWFKLPFRLAWPNPFFASPANGTVLEPDGASLPLYLTTLSAKWDNDTDGADTKWNINTAGYYKLTVNTNTQTMSLATVIPSHPDAEFIGGVLWAKYNVASAGTFASSSQDAGAYFQFPSSTALSASSTWPGLPAASNDDWYSNTPCPSGWKLPRNWDSASEKIMQVGYQWRNANEADNTVAGAFFGDNAATATIGDPKGCIFVPAAGRRSPSDGQLEGVGAQGWLLTGNPYWGVSSVILVFDATGRRWDMQDAQTSPTNWGTAANVRCIKE